MAKKKPGRQWTWTPSKTDKPKVPDDLKKEVQTKADDLVANVLKPLYIQPPPEGSEWNYPIDIWTKWNRSFFYFTSTWANPGPNRIAATFESPFARMEYIEDGRFNLAYFRHTGKWVEIFTDLSMNECLKLIAEDGPFTLV